MRYGKKTYSAQSKMGKKLIREGKGEFLGGSISRGSTTVVAGGARGAKKLAKARAKQRRAAARRLDKKAGGVAKRGKKARAGKARAKKKSGKKSKSSKRSAAARKAAKTRAKNKAKRSAAARKGARKRSGKSSGRKAARRKGGKKKATRGRRARPRVGPPDKRRAARARRAGIRKRTKKVTLRAGRRMAAWRKRKLIKQGFLSSRGAVNPRVRRNPPGIVEAFKRSIGNQSMLVLGGQAVAGMGGAVVLPALAETYLGKYGVRNSGGQGVALSAAATGLMFWGGSFLESFLARQGMAYRPVQGLGFGLALGGVINTIVRGVYEYAPKLADWLKLSEPRRPVVRLPSSGGSSGGAVNGLRDWMELRGMGMGAVTDPEALVAGESFARSVNQMSDWMELSGLGSPADRVPASSILAPGQLGLLPGGGSYPGQYGGGGFGRMGDWVEMAPDSTLASQGFQPAMETF